MSEPLFDAIIAGDADAVVVLLRQGADANAWDEARTVTPIMTAVGFNEAGGLAGMNALGLAADALDVEMVKLLLAHGADPHVQDADRMTVFDHLRLGDPPEEPAAQERLREIRRLIGAPDPTESPSGEKG